MNHYLWLLVAVALPLLVVQMKRSHSKAKADEDRREKAALRDVAIRYYRDASGHGFEG